MTVFSSVEAAERHGFRWLEYQAGVGLHLVVRDVARADGVRVRMLAFAKP